jgi:diacylglycerol O-acyltransferase / wax synthase
MDRLSAVDASFLYMETPETPMNIGSLTIFAPPPDPSVDVFQSFRDHTVARLDLLPSYRRRLQMFPLRLVDPVWILEEELDLDYHLRLADLPQPGTIEQLRSLVAELHAVPLDRARPLWQYHLIRGVAAGGFAVYVKVHHAAMDGMAGIAALPAIYDVSPVPAPVADHPERDPHAVVPPGVVDLIGAAFDDFLSRERRLFGIGPKLATALANVGRRAGKTLALMPEIFRLAPKTLFNVSISGERSYGTVSVCLTQVKRIAKARRVTINDVVMAVCAGALCRYLSARMALPSKPLIAAVPVSLREPGHTEMTIQVAAVLSSLATDIADPLQRLAAIARSAHEAKGRLVDIKDLVSADLSLLGPPLMATGLAWLAGYAHVFDFVPNVMNLWISNVPGPRQPMYCAGAPAQHYYPVSIANHGCALNITAQSYLDNIEFGLTACRLAVPDAQIIADDIVLSLEDLARASAAAEGAGAIEIIEIATPESVPTAAMSTPRPARKPVRKSRRAAAQPQERPHA